MTESVDAYDGKMPESMFGVNDSPFNGEKENKGGIMWDEDASGRGEHENGKSSRPHRFDNRRRSEEVDEWDEEGDELEGGYEDESDEWDEDEGEEWE